MGGPEYPTSDDARSKREILENLRVRAEAGYGPAQTALKQLVEAADIEGLTVDDYVDMADAFQQADRDSH